MARTDWGFDCCNPVPVADYAKDPAPQIFLRHVGLECYQTEEPLSFTELQQRVFERTVSKLARQRRRR